MLTHKQSIVFTDGSVYGGIVGCGACAVVHCISGSDDDCSVTVKEVGYHVSSEKCEIEGIILGLEVVIRLIVEGHGQGHNACVIFCVIVKRP